MKLLDTNVVIYAIGKAHPYKGPCEKIMERAAKSPGEFTIDSEMLQEILHIFWLRQQREKGIEVVESLLQMFPDVIPVGATEIYRAMRIFGQHSHLSARDAIHAAVVSEHRLDGIVSADRAFDGVAGVTRYDPGEAARGW